MERRAVPHRSNTPLLRAASMIFLQRLHRVTGLLQGGNTERRGPRAAERGHNRRVRVNRGGADFHLISARHLAGGGVNNQMNLAILEQVKRVGASFSQLENALYF